jgi:hypothetical protein
MRWGRGDVGYVPGDQGMDAVTIESAETSVLKYTSPWHAQVWNLRRSRRGWKKKYVALKIDQKRLQNRVRDVSHSREAWRLAAEAAEQRVRELEAANAALQQQAAASPKKS